MHYISTLLILGALLGACPDESNQASITQVDSVRQELVQSDASEHVDVQLDTFEETATDTVEVEDDTSPDVPDSSSDTNEGADMFEVLDDDGEINTSSDVPDSSSDTSEDANGEVKPLPECEDDTDCDDANACTTDSCNPETNDCYHEDIDKCFPCEVDADCPPSYNICEEGDNGEGDWGSVSWWCDPIGVCKSSGVSVHCLYGCISTGVMEFSSESNCAECATDTHCDDANACTADVCVDKVCSNEPLDGMSCDDGDTCTTDDICSATGTCTGTALLDTDGEGICDIYDACDFDDQNTNSPCASVLMCWATSGCPSPPYYPPIWSYEDWLDGPPACEDAPGVPSTNFWPTASSCCVVGEVINGSPCFYNKHTQFELPPGNFDAYEHFGP